MQIITQNRGLQQNSNSTLNACVNTHNLIGYKFPSPILRIFYYSKLPLLEVALSIMLQNILYLHGFRSSPMSFKARYLSNLFAKRYPEIHWTCPQLPPSPLEASELMLDLTANWPANTSAVIGSSLGGFYAAWLARRSRFKSILINPATDPARDLTRYIGTQTQWQNPGESFHFKEQYLQELLNLYPDPSLPVLDRPQSSLLMASTGDEVLSWHEMVEVHRNAVHYIIQGSDHAMSDFEQHVQVVIDFLEL